MKNMVDVCVGPLKQLDLGREIRHYILKRPKRIVVDIKSKKDGYHVTIWIGEKDFHSKC